MKLKEIYLFDILLLSSLQHLSVNFSSSIIKYNFNLKLKYDIIKKLLNDFFFRLNRYNKRIKISKIELI